MTPDHLRLPLRFVRGRAVTVAQGSGEELLQNVEVILRYPQGFRLDDPEFGIPDPAFAQGGPDLGPIREAIERYEERADALVTGDDRDLAELVARVRVDVGGA